jgi:hypothetical protein
MARGTVCNTGIFQVIGGCSRTCCDLGVSGMDWGVGSSREGPSLDLTPFDDTM